MQVEHIAGVSFTPGRAAQQQRNLAVSPGMLGEVVIDHQGIAAGLHELLADGAAGIGGNVLQGCRLIGGGDHHGGVLHGAEALQDGHGAGDGGFLLPDRHVDADQVFALLVDDGVDGKGGLAGLPVANDQLALAATDGDHRVDGFDAGLHRGVHVLAHDHARRNALDRAVAVDLDRTFAVDRLTQGIDHAADQAIANRHRGNAPGGAHLHAFFDAGIFTHDDDADQVALQVEGDAHHTVGELDQLLGAHIAQAADAGNAIAGLHHRADIADIQLRLEIIDLLLADRR